MFISLVDLRSIQERHIYTDLLREFQKNGHSLYIISPIEKRHNQKTHIIREENTIILKLRIGNIQKVGAVEKGISTVAIEPQFLFAIKKYFKDIKFDAVLYPTPPITFCKAVEYVKKRDGARTYLLLKDIFPQNAVDIGMLSKAGMKGIFYRRFRRQEKRLYYISDRIGCMSQANVEYVLKHNPEISRKKVEVCPNSVEPMDMNISVEERKQIRRKYNIPLDRTVFIYGGNLGKPQGISFMLRCIFSQRKNDKVFFLIVGNGTEYSRIEHYVNKHKPNNVMLRQWLPKEEYDRIVAACDVGMVFLDHRFTIPNFPSRILNYMQCRLPVLACTDSNTDLGNLVAGLDKNGKKTHEPFGWWCESNDTEAFKKIIKRITEHAVNQLGIYGFEYLESHYTVAQSYSMILEGISK